MTMKARPFVMLWGFLLGVSNVNLATGQVWIAEHDHDVHCVAFSSDGKLMATGSLHNERTEKHRGDESIPDDLPEGIKKRITRRGGEVILWDVATGMKRATFRAHNDCVCAVAFSPDGQTLASANEILIGVPGRDRSCDVVLWDIKARKKQAALVGHPGEVRFVAFSPDSRTLASASFDGTIIIWDARTKKRLTLFHVDVEELSSAAYSPDGRTLAIASQAGSVTFWSPRTGKKQGDVQRILGFRGCMSLAFSSNGKLLAGALLPTNYVNEPDSSAVHVWELARSETDPLQIATYEVCKFKQHTHLIGAVAFSPDGRTAASGGLDKTVRIWNPATGEELAVLKGHTQNVDAVAFLPTGRYLASVSWDKTVRLWDVSTILRKK